MLLTTTTRSSRHRSRFRRVTRLVDVQTEPDHAAIGPELAHEDLVVVRIGGPVVEDIADRRVVACLEGTVSVGLDLDKGCSSPLEKACGLPDGNCSARIGSL